MMHGQKNIRS